MKVISEADVVLALGTRLGPFGSLPQYNFDYWPKSAKIIQVDIAHRRLGLTKDIDIGICGDAKLGEGFLSDWVGAFSQSVEKREICSHWKKICHVKPESDDFTKCFKK